MEVKPIKSFASAYIQVEFVSVFDSLTDQANCFQKIIQADGLHLVTSYQVLLKLWKTIFYS